MAQSPVMIQNVARAGRRRRAPQHPFLVEHQPWVIQPICIAPVLPGDTMENLLLQARAVSSTVKHPLVGWHLEYYFFYVPHRAMSSSPTYQQMMLDTGVSAPVDATGREDWYRYDNSPNYIGESLIAVVAEYFRDQDEGAGNTAGHLGANYLAQLNRSSWLDSVMNAAEWDAANHIDAVPVVDGPDAGSTLDAHEIDAAMRHYQMLKDAALTDQTYEDFLRTYGVRIPDREQIIRPELLRYVREWTYPVNHVDPSTGAPSTALSWSIAERADKARLFKEPGFILGVTVARPKVYFSRQKGSAVGMLDNVFGWLPAVLGNDPYASLKRLAAGSGPLPGNTDAYIVDLKDLYLYGDQFVNVALATPGAHGVNIAVPTATLNKKYVAQSDIDGLFTAPETAKVIRQDGVVSLNIQSRVVDTTAKV